MTLLCIIIITIVIGVATMEYDFNEILAKIAMFEFLLLFIMILIWVWVL